MKRKEEINNKNSLRHTNSLSLSHSCSSLISLLTAASSLGSRDLSVSPSCPFVSRMWMNEGKSHLIALPLSSFVLILSVPPSCPHGRAGGTRHGGRREGKWRARCVSGSLSHSFYTFPLFPSSFHVHSPSFGFWSYIGEVTWRRKVKGKGKWKKRNVHHPSSPFTSRWLRVEDVMWERDRPFPSLSCPSSQFLSPLRLASWIGNCKDKGSERERGEERDQLSPPIHLFLRSSPFLLSVMIAYVRAKRLDVRTLPSPTLYSPASQLGACVCSLAKPFNSLSS